MANVFRFLLRRSLHAAVFYLTALTALLVAGSASATTIIGGNVVNQTWSPAGNPYIVQGDITVPAGATLTIQAGTIVQFATGDGQAAGIDVARTEVTIRGTLAVDGTFASPVTFQAQTGTAAGTWYGIIADAGAASVNISWANIKNAVNGIRGSAAGSVLSVNRTNIDTSTYGVYLTAGSPSFDRVNATSTSYGYYVSGAAVSPTITNCLVYANTNYRFFISTSGASTVGITGCTIHSNGLYGVYTATTGTLAVNIKNSNITNNASYGVYRLSGTVNLTYSNAWNNGINLSGVTSGTGVFSCNPLYVNASNLRLTSNSPSRAVSDIGGDLGPLGYIADATPGLYGTLHTDTTVPAGVTQVPGDLIVPAGVTLTLSPGATLQFAPTDVMACGIDPARGELSVDGTLNAAGSTPEPVTLTSTGNGAGAWYGVELFAGGSTVAHTKIDKAVRGITHSPSSGTNAIHHDAISGSSYGIYLTTGTPTFDAITLSNNGYGFYLNGTASPTITNAIVTGNTNYGFYLNGSASVIGIVNSTIHANGLYGIYSTTATTQTTNIVNSIITNNSTYGVYRSSGTVTLLYSDVWGNTIDTFGVSAGTGSISQNPNYVAAPTNLSLTTGSVCIDSGTAAGSPNHDVNDGPRPVDGDGINGAAFDMGAYEVAPAGYCGDGVPQSGEACDDGVANGTYNQCKSDCTGIGPHCGDSATNGPEQCDDGNTTGGDRCSSVCTTEVVADGGDAGDGGNAASDGSTVIDSGSAADADGATLAQDGAPADGGAVVDGDAAAGLLDGSSQDVSDAASSIADGAVSTDTGAPSNDSGAPSTDSGATAHAGPDGAITTSPDAGDGVSAGEAADSGGCSCRMTSPSGGAAPISVLAIGAALALQQRRRRRTTRDSDAR